MTDTTETPEAAPETEAAAPEASIDLAEALLAKDQEIADLKDRLLRAAAELENTRRRLEREKADTAYAVTNFARDMLAVADNLGRAVAALPAEGFDQVRAGITATERELLAIFGRHGITRIEASGKLDPNRHQAMLEVETADVEPGHIVAELAPGYAIKDRLLRAAMVSVAKAG
jgi:molecular chaperone GrpE